jgi:hypothetical protein
VRSVIGTRTDEPLLTTTTRNRELRCIQMITHTLSMSQLLCLRREAGARGVFTRIFSSWIEQIRWRPRSCPRAYRYRSTQYHNKNLTGGFRWYGQLSMEMRGRQGESNQSIGRDANSVVSEYRFRNLPQASACLRNVSDQRKHIESIECASQQWRALLPARGAVCTHARN